MHCVVVAYQKRWREMVKMRIVAAILLGAFGAHPAVPNASAATFLEIAIAGAPDHGIFDPSVASDGTGKFYMAVSGVASSTPGGTFKSAAVRTYLASSSDQGKVGGFRASSTRISGLHSARRPPMGAGKARSQPLSSTRRPRPPRGGSSSGISILTLTATANSSMGGSPTRKRKRQVHLPLQSR